MNHPCVTFKTLKWRICKLWATHVCLSVTHWRTQGPCVTLLVPACLTFYILLVLSYFYNSYSFCNLSVIQHLFKSFSTTCMTWFVLFVQWFFQYTKRCTVDNSPFLETKLCTENLVLICCLNTVVFSGLQKWVACAMCVCVCVYVFTNWSLMRKLMKYLYYSDLHPFQTTPTLSLFPFPFISLSLSSSHLCSLPLPTPFYLFLFSSYPLFVSQTTNPSQTILSSVLPKLCLPNCTISPHPFNLLPSDKQRCTVTQ